MELDGAVGEQRMWCGVVVLRGIGGHSICLMCSECCDRHSATQPAQQPVNGLPLCSVALPRTAGPYHSPYSYTLLDHYIAMAHRLDAASIHQYSTAQHSMTTPSLGCCLPCRFSCCGAPVESRSIIQLSRWFPAVLQLCGSWKANLAMSHSSFTSLFCHGKLWHERSVTS